MNKVTVAVALVVFYLLTIGSVIIAVQLATPRSWQTSLIDAGATVADHGIDALFRHHSVKVKTLKSELKQCRAGMDLHSIINDAQKQWAPDIAPAMMYAQLQVESSLNPRARSRAGAVGIAQFELATWREVGKKIGMPRHTKRSNVDWSIHAQAYLLQSNYEAVGRLTPVPNHPQLTWLMLAAYDCGLHCVKTAWNKCHEKIKECVPKETADYPGRVISQVHFGNDDRK